MHHILWTRLQQALQFNSEWDVKHDNTNLPLPVSHSLKNFSSALNTARWYWSIGIQYLFSKKLSSIYYEYDVSLPYSMNPFLEEGGLCAFSDKVLHLLKFHFAASLESPRVVKDEAWITSEDHLIFDVVDSTLGTHWLSRAGDPRRQMTLTSLDSWICARSTWSQAIGTW